MWPRVTLGKIISGNSNVCFLWFLGIISPSSLSSFFSFTDPLSMTILYFQAVSWDASLQAVQILISRTIPWARLFIPPFEQFPRKKIYFPTFSKETDIQSQSIKYKKPSKRADLDIERFLSERCVIRRRQSPWLKRWWWFCARWECSFVIIALPLSTCRPTADGKASPLCK